MVSWNLLCTVLALSALNVNAQLLTHFLAPLAGYMKQIPAFTIPTPSTLGSDTTTVSVTDSGINRVDNDIDDTAPTKPAFVLENGPDTNLLEKLGLVHPTVAPKAETPTTTDVPDSELSKRTKASPIPVQGGQQTPGVGEQAPFRVSGITPQRQFVPDQRKPQAFVPSRQQWSQQPQPQGQGQGQGQQQFPQGQIQPQFTQGQQRPPFPQQQQQFFQQPSVQQPQFFQPGPFGQQRQQQNQGFDRRQQGGLPQDPRALQNRFPQPQNPGQLIPGQVDRQLPADNRFQPANQNQPNNRFPQVRNDQGVPAGDKVGPWIPPQPKFSQQPVANNLNVASGSVVNPNETTSSTPDLTSSSQSPPAQIQAGVAVNTQVTEQKIDKSRGGPQNVRRQQLPDDTHLQPQQPPATGQPDNPSRNQQLLQRFGLADSETSSQ